MFEQAAGPLTKHGVSLAKLLYRKIVPPKFGYKVAPKNILEVISPFTYQGKVLEVLGQPHELHNKGGSSSLAYRFANALLQIDLTGDAIESVALVSLRMRWPNRFSIFPLSLQLGAHTFGDLQGEKISHVRIDAAPKYFVASTKCFFGFPGRYLNYHFASISAATFPAIPDQNLELDRGDDKHIMLLQPDKTRFNAVAISRSEDDSFPFYWGYFS